MNIKHRILTFLIEHKEESFSMHQLSQLIHIDYKLIHTSIKKLFEDHSLTIENFKNQKRCSFKNQFNEDIFSVEYQRRTLILKKKEFRAIYDYLQKLPEQFILLLFGSHVKGTATKHSDFDFLLISPEEIVKKVEEKLSILPFNIHLTPVTYKSFIRMLKSKEFSVVSEVLKKNIIFFGIEDY